MTDKILGIATIGQAPREDIAALFRTYAPRGARVVLRGCLDGLSDAEIADRPPVSGADALYTRLRGERDVKISKRHVIEHAPKAIAALRADGADAIVFACTGEFPPMPGDAGVLFPSRVLAGLVQGLLPRGRLGLLIPLPEQAEKLPGKWKRDGVEVVFEPLAPSADAETAAAAARKLKAKAPDIVAMDCMSYGPATKEVVKRELGVPTVLAVSATGRVLQELLT
jgi:protein AroM